MHVLLLPSWFDTVDKPWRGTFFRDQARALARQGIRTGIAFVERRSLSRIRPSTFSHSHFQTVFDDGEVPIVRLRGWSIAAQTIAGGLLWCALTRHVVRQYVKIHGVPDLIHGHAVLWGGYAAMQVAADLNRPYVITEHSSRILTGALAPARRSMAAAAYSGAAAVIAVSRALKESVDRIGYRTGAIVVPNTVDTDYFAPLPRGRRAAAPFRFLMVCDLVRGKCADLALRALARLRRSGSAATLTLVGTGNHLGRLRRVARDEGVADDVEFAGALDRAGVRAAMRHSDALILPSEVETFGVVLIEALATGIPVIATRSGGPSEIVTPDTGFLIDTGDEKQLRTAMRQMTRSHFAPASLHAYAVSQFGYERVGRALMGVYERVLGAIAPAAEEPARAASAYAL